MANRRKIITTVILVALIIIIYIQIFWFSNMPIEMSQDYSMSVTEQIVNLLENTFSINLSFNDSREQISQLNSFVRKAAHFFQYAVLGLLTYSIALLWGKKGLHGTLLPFLIVVLMAAADEFHQRFVPGRSGSISDVFLDSAGCIFGMILIRMLSNFYVSRRAKRNVSQMK
jgi:VanZ family protein